MIAYRRLPLEGLLNARELGGFNIPGGVTRHGVFLRSEVPTRLSDGDLAFLRGYGLTTVIDFRSGVEIEKAPDRLASEGWVSYLHMPCIDEKAAQGAGKREHRVPGGEAGFRWGDHYIIMAEEHRDWFRTVLEALSRAEGAALFHCTTGKDRTGLITAALLSLCGVSQADIVADYCVSQVYLKPLYRNMTHLMPPGFKADLSNPFFSTAPENMEALLEHMDRTYGGMAGFVADCGVSAETAEALRKKLSGA